MKFPRLRVHLLTAIVLQIVMGALIWANVRERRIDLMEGYPPDATNDSGIEGSFDCGWPVMLQRQLSQKVRTAQGTVLDAVMPPIWSSRGMLINAATALSFLIVTWLTCERLLYKKSNAEGAA